VASDRSFISYGPPYDIVRTPGAACATPTFRPLRVVLVLPLNDPGWRLRAFSPRSLIPAWWDGVGGGPVSVATFLGGGPLTGHLGRA